MPRITFVKQKKTFEVEPGTILRTAAMHNGIEVYAGIHKTLHCPGWGQCASCRVLITKGQENVSKPGWWERFRMSFFPLFPLVYFWRIGHEKELRLSCQCRVNGDIEVETTPTGNWHGERFWG